MEPTLPRAGEPGLQAALAQLPAVDRLLRHPALVDCAERLGTAFAKRAVQATLAAAREVVRAGGVAPDFDALACDSTARAEQLAAPRLAPVFNLTGTVIHTNLGRALMGAEAVDAVKQAMSEAVALEFDVAGGARGDRDTVVEDWLCQLTGAEAATVVNNNAAAVLLALTALAKRREVLISRGELIEIGGAFRLPDIMAAAGAKLVEVGTTNRTHARDFASAIGPCSALVMKAHASNYAITGFTSAVPEAELAALAHEAGLPFFIDLGAGALLELERWGLPHEPTPREAIAAGADLVSFSGDKLLGGPQAGILVGKSELITQLKRHPLKRALRMDKLGLAALEATLRVIASDYRLEERLPTLALLSRAPEQIRAACERVAPALAAFAGPRLALSIEACASQIGSGAQPVERLASWALVLRPASGRGLKSLEARLRALPQPVIGRCQDGALWLDARTLTDEAGFIANLAAPC